MVGERTFDTRLGKTKFVPATDPINSNKANSIAEKVRDNGKLARVVKGSKGSSVLIGPRRKPKTTKTDYKTTSRNKYNRMVNDPKRISSVPNSVAQKMAIEARNNEFEIEFAKIKRFSLIVGFVHLIAGISMLIFANTDFIIEITSTFSAGPPGCTTAEVEPCERFVINNFDAQLAYWVAGFSLLSALFHFLTISGAFVGQYASQLQQNRNAFRWIEYALSSTLMILIIMLLSGLTTFSSLIGVAFANIGMILFGWVSEIANPRDRKKTDWTPFIFGCIMGLGAWLALYGSLFLNLAQLGLPLTEIPTFVWFIIITQFALFNVFGVNHAYQLTSSSNSTYLDGERYYIWLSLISKSLLAWSIYVNTLIL